MGEIGGTVNPLKYWNRCAVCRHGDVAGVRVGMLYREGRSIDRRVGWRRPEILNELEREVIGRVPPNAPKIKWAVTKTVNDTVWPCPVNAEERVGRAENRAFPETQ